jgi:hypothetical protein
MKKNQVKNVSETKKLKKLQLSREILQTLTSSDAQKVVGGIDSCLTGGDCSEDYTGCETS